MSHHILPTSSYSTDPISSMDRKHLTTQSFHFVTVSDKSGYDSCYVIILSDAKPSFKADALSGHILWETTRIATHFLN